MGWKDWPKWTKVLIIVLLLVALFFPKPAGEFGSGLPPPTDEYSWIDKECSCIGYKFDATPNLADAAHPYLCAGIPHSCECIENTYNRETKERTSKQVVCD